MADQTEKHDFHIVDENNREHHTNDVAYAYAASFKDNVDLYQMTETGEKRFREYALAHNFETPSTKTPPKIVDFDVVAELRDDSRWQIRCDEAPFLSDGIEPNKSLGLLLATVSAVAQIGRKNINVSVFYEGRDANREVL